MTKPTKKFLGLILMIGLGADVFASDLSTITNYREYSPDLASSGQPLAMQFEMLKENGFERIVYLAFTNSGKAIPNEDVIVKELGMDYVHVPVIWESPTKSDFYAFADIMRRDSSKKTLVHCQVNYRASAFSFLYRVLYQDVPVKQAKRDLDKVWQPDDTWRELIFAILEENGQPARCEGCNWNH